MGLAQSPGTAVLPKCSIRTITPSGRRASREMSAFLFEHAGPSRVVGHHSHLVFQNTCYLFIPIFHENLHARQPGGFGKGSQIPCAKAVCNAIRNFIPLTMAVYVSFSFSKRFIFYLYDSGPGCQSVCFPQTSLEEIPFGINSVRRPHKSFSSHTLAVRPVMRSESQSLKKEAQINNLSGHA